MPPENLPIIPTTPQPAPRTPPKRKAWLLWAVCFACAVFFGGIFFFSTKHQGTSVAPPAAATSSVRAHSRAFEGLSLEAKAVYVIDIRDDETLYEENGDIALPLASVTKLLTALVAVQSLPGDAIITIPAAALATEGDSGLSLGEAWDLQELVAFMLVTSSNDAATALRLAYEAETGGSFIAAMNSEAARLGMSRSSFQNETGLDIGTSASNAGSAKDAAMLLAAVIRGLPDALDSTRGAEATFISRSGRVHAVKNTNELADAIPWAVGAKTGFTDSAGGNLVISFDASLGHPVVIAVLGSSREGRFADVEKLVRATLSAIQEG